MLSKLCQRDEMGLIFTHVIVITTWKNFIVANLQQSAIYQPDNKLWISLLLSYYLDHLMFDFPKLFMFSGVVPFCQIQSMRKDNLKQKREKLSV